MDNMTIDDMKELRRAHARSRNKDRWTINEPLSDKEYKKALAKDKLTHEQRVKIDEVKASLTYPEDKDLW